MAFSPQEQEIIKYGRANNKSRAEVESAIAKLRTGYVPPPAPVVKPTDNRNLLEKAGSVALGVNKGLAEGAIGTASALQAGGQGVMALIGGALDPNKTIGETWNELRANTGYQSLQGEQKKQIDDLLKAQNPEEKAGKVIGFIGEILAGGGAKVLRDVGTAGFKAVENLAERAVVEAPELATSPKVNGIIQTGKELLERVPRFFGRVQEGVTEAGIRAEKIRTATPEIAQALKVNLPEKYINTIEQADDVTKQAYKRVLDIAEETPKTVGVKTNPTIVGGELAGKQYETIDKQRRLVGSQIGEQIEKLGKSKVTANMGASFKQIDDVLSQNGIKVGLDGKLSFVGKFTPAERARIQELYTLSREAGETLTAKQVRDMDNLFSKLQRETRMEGIGDLRVSANGQDMSLFRIFRDVYSNQLENIAPEIKALNREYRNLITLTDDIEDSIIKTPNFNITKATDPAEFAKVNLRRIFGESQSSPAYEAIADEMDTIARQLGYADAKPKDVAAFAQEIRELFPTSIPRTGFTGGIRAGISDIIEKVSEVGAPNVKDQQKALRALLDSLKKAK